MATSQTHTPAPPPRYAALKTTALAFITAQSHTPSLPTAMDFASLRALATPSFTHTFGPAFSVSQAPKLQGRFSMDAFVAHLEGMVPHLESWAIEVRGVVVDEVEGNVVVRASYYMHVRGETVENEVVWWLEMEEEGSGEWKVSRSMEIVDAGAAGRIREVMMMGKGEGE